MKRVKKSFIILPAILMMFTIFPIQAEAAILLNKTTVSNCSGKIVNFMVSGTKYQCEIKAKSPYLNKTKLKISKGQSYSLKLVGTTAKTWKSSNKAVATVSNKGKVTAKKPGTSTITCIGKNGKSYKCKITVVKNESADDSNNSDNSDNADDSDNLSDENVYKAMTSLKNDYPEGMTWTNDNYYAWKGGIYSGGYGCAGFAFMLSDAAFGNLPARTHNNFSNIRVGDIIRMNYDTHSVIVLVVKDESVIVAEGNYNSSIHWGREILLSEIKKTGTYVMTRYPK